MASANNVFAFEEIEADSGRDTTFICEEINKELEEYLLEKHIDADSTDSIFDVSENFTNHLYEDFDELIGEDSNKEHFIKALMHIFALLLNTKANTADKMKRIIKIAVEKTLKKWQGQK